MKVLIADDETLIRLDLRQLLARNGVHVCGEARDGEEAIELARRLQPDVAILDVRMPRVDGIGAARRMLAERPIPIVLLTALSGRRLVTKAVEAGVFAYLVKPFREQDVLPAIQTAVARHEELLRARRELGRQPLREAPVEMVVNAPSGARWPLRVTRAPDGSVEVSLAEPA